MNFETAPRKVVPGKNRRHKLLPPFGTWDSFLQALGGDNLYYFGIRHGRPPSDEEEAIEYYRKYEVPTILNEACL